MMFYSDEVWDKDRFVLFVNSRYSFEDCYICENRMNRPGYHLAIRIFNSCGGNAEWTDVKYLDKQELIAALEAGIPCWNFKPRIRVPAATGELVCMS